MPIVNIKKHGKDLCAHKLVIPGSVTIVLTPEECLGILKSVNDVIKDNPINVGRIINVIHLAGEAAKIGLNPSDIILSKIVECHNTFVKTSEEETP